MALKDLSEITAYICFVGFFQRCKLYSDFSILYRDRIPEKKLSTCNDKFTGVAVPSTSERTDATQSVLDRNITRKSRMKTTKSSHKKSIKGTSINTSKDKGANIKKNLKLEISMPLEQTQVESISERRTKEYEDKAEAKH